MAKKQQKLELLKLEYQADCVKKVVEMLGRQQLLPDALKIPAGIICQDAKQTATSLKRLQDFAVVTQADIVGNLCVIADIYQIKHSVLHFSGRGPRPAFFAGTGHLPGSRRAGQSPPHNADLHPLHVVFAAQASAITL